MIAVSQIIFASSVRERAFLEQESGNIGLSRCIENRLYDDQDRHGE